ncbi:MULTISPECIES: DUF5615 family PIN-like protein [unclassified Mesotoga]|uniref:DUF5615 family PIN-like protein n=1 Tax=unclassified Mesotoga TaxID=1184398 RepID=UPI001FAF158E|nr:MULTISPECIES: DUF5615 family PIN-like protein [unclassified Mesotoga]
MYYATRTCTLLPKRSETLSLLADENIDQRLVSSLRLAGISVYSVAESATGITDEEVMGLSKDLGALILTDDKDFGEIVFRKQRSCPGIVLLRLTGVDYSCKADQVIQVIKKYGSEMIGKFVVITAERVRIRKFLPGAK